MNMVDPIALLRFMEVSAYEGGRRIMRSSIRWSKERARLIWSSRPYGSIIGKEDNPKIYRMQEEIRSVVKHYNGI